MLGGGGFNDEVENEGNDFNQEVDIQPRTTTALEEADFKPESMGIGTLEDANNRQPSDQF